MRKEYDFSKGRQGRFAGMKIEVIGGTPKSNPSPPPVLALCIDNSGFDLILGKIYSVTVGDDWIFEVDDESGDDISCPSNVFLPLEFEPQVEKKIRQLVIA